MAQITFRLNVTSSQFPFLSDRIGATVIVPNQDTYYVRPNAFTGETADKNIGIPQFSFMENVMPSSSGYSSVGYNAATVEYLGTFDSIQQSDQFLYLRGRTGKRYLMNFNRQNGRGFIYSTELGEWINLFLIPVALSQAYTCLVKGRCFIFFKNHDTAFEFGGFNAGTGSFDLIVYSGFLGITDLTQFFGMVSANNYLIFFTRTLIVYTIPTEFYGDLPDFTPSLGQTGASSETPSVLKGVILTCLPTQDGFDIFTSTNIVTAYYSGNIQFPWTYRELEGSAAINNLDVIAADKDGYSKYAYTSAGLLKIGKSSCTPVFVEAAEFIGNNVFEYFNWPTKSIQKVTLSEPMNVSLSYVANRWLVISYGVTGSVFTHAIIWDEHLKRWGKLQQYHSRVVEFFGIPSTINPIPAYTYQELLNLGWSYQTLLDLMKTYFDLGGVDYSGNPDIELEYSAMGLVGLTGIVNVVDFDVNVNTNQSIAILSRLQFTRTSRFKITDIWVENLNDNPVGENTTVVAVKSTDDMKNPIRTEYGYPMFSNLGGVKHYLYAKAEGLNHELHFEGDFDLSTIVVVGKRTGTAYGRGFGR